MTETSLSTRLESEEQIINRGLKTFIEVGAALTRIRDGKLWQAGGRYASFDAYCEERWGWKSRYVSLVCGSAKAALDAVKGDKRTMVRPENERQARPLTKLPEEDRADAWGEVVKESEDEGKPVTAAKVQEVVTRRMEPKESAEWDPQAMPDAPANNPDSLENVQADIAILVDKLKEAHRLSIKTFDIKGGEINRPYCSRYTVTGLTKQLNSIVRYLKDWMPTGGEPGEPTVQRDDDVQRAGSNA